VFDRAGTCSGDLSAGTWGNHNPGGQVDPSAPTTVDGASDDGSWILSPCVWLDSPSTVDNGDGTVTITSVYGSAVGHTCSLISNVFNGEVTTTNVSTHDVAAGYAIVGDVSFTLSAATDANLFSVTSIGTFDSVDMSTGSLLGSLGASSSGGLVADCNTDCGGSAVSDSCDDCVGGNTGLEACLLDCAGTPGGNLTLDECGICGGAGIVEGACDCDGNVLDECGVCGGNGFDSDSDGLCDNLDDCIGEYDECGICNGPGVPAQSNKHASKPVLPLTHTPH
jgi:hypothetical protein